MRVLSVLLLAFLLVSCGGSDSGGQPSTNQSDNPNPRVIDDDEEQGDPCAAENVSAGTVCSDQTVYVSATLVTTPQDATGGSMNWGAAQSYCNNLNQLTHSDWRLPNGGELNSLYTNRVSIGGFDLGGDAYWTSDTNSQGDYRVLYFDSGGGDFRRPGDPGLVRCIRTVTLNP